MPAGLFNSLCIFSQQLQFSGARATDVWLRRDSSTDCILFLFFRNHIRFPDNIDLRVQTTGDGTVLGYS